MKNDTELLNAREKLRELEERYETRLKEKAAEPHARQLTLESLKRMIDQLKEDITRLLGSSVLLWAVHLIAHWKSLGNFGR